ncbi:OsmC family protein [Halorubrum sp. SY-15]|uniref:OsmC family protein n=1 Tax=Halorubrum sp. SY-15 TaxID=3402277 RepID=UPI003EB815CC
MSDAGQQSVTFDTHTELDAGTRVSVETREFTYVIDEPESLGGTNAGPNPVEYLLGALGGCLSIVGHAVAAEMDLELESLAVDVDGELNPARFQGAAVDSRAGYQQITASIRAELTDAAGDPVDDETEREWLERTEDRCPVSDNLAAETPVDLSLE